MSENFKVTEELKEAFKDPKNLSYSDDMQSTFKGIQWTDVDSVTDYGPYNPKINNKQAIYNEGHSAALQGMPRLTLYKELNKLYLEHGLR